MRNGTASIILKNERALHLAASAGRISTQKGGALEIFAGDDDRERDIRLVKKVLSSGHSSLLEHQTFGIAFDGVSVMVEQFMIEFRLASFTVKSRRYVDFADAGYVTPSGLPESVLNDYRARCDALFTAYTELTEMGIPKEDARFVLPYSFRSNFYVTLNARELVNVICSMLYGRGKRHEELVYLGEMLKSQFDKQYPDVIETQKWRYEHALTEAPPERVDAGEPIKPNVLLISETQDMELTLKTAMRFSGRFAGDMITPENMHMLITDPRPRELEQISAGFLIENISLSCVTHFARHRMQSILFNEPPLALSRGDYVLPDSIANNPEALAIYTRVFQEQPEFAAKIPVEYRAYCALSGHVTDIMLTMNARELLHFMKLRTCTRAQWEIREVANAMLAELRALAPDIFYHFGASCITDGRCPEGRLSCGRIKEIRI